MDFKNPEQVREFVRDQQLAYGTAREQIAVRTGVDGAYYEGLQYRNYDTSIIARNTTGRILSRAIDPESQKLRVVQNRTTRFIIKVAAATMPSKFEVSARPTGRAIGPSSAHTAQVLEDAVQCGMEQWGFLHAAQTAQSRRCIAGTYGVGLHLRTMRRKLKVADAEQAYEDCRLEAFHFHPLRLVLDPAVDHRDLRRHPFVIYQDAWPLDKILRAFPDLKAKLAEHDLKTIGQLLDHECAIAENTNGRLFADYQRYSRTKGAIVSQVHTKDEAGRWSRMHVLIDVPTHHEALVVNMDEPISPFGGDGLPLVLLHAHPRSSGMFGISDVAMVKDAQDVRNLTSTWLHRIAQRCAAPQKLVDKRWLGRNVSDEDVRHRISNTPGAIITGNPVAGDKAAQPPVWVQPPQPPQYLAEMGAEADSDMYDNSFRTEGSFGKDMGTSHVPYQTRVLANQNADQVLDQRVEQDIGAYQDLLEVGLGTEVLHVHQGRPTTLAYLRKAGFGEDDIAELLNVDPYDLPVRLEIDRASVRHRSVETKRSELMQLADKQQIMPDKLARALADLDVPLTDEDRHMRQQTEKLIARLLSGQPWTPLPFGPERNAWLLAKLEDALIDRVALDNPEVQAMVAQAIQAQQMVGMQAQMAQTMAETPPPTQQSTQQQGPQALLNASGPITLSQVLDATTATDGGLSAPPAAA